MDVTITYQDGRESVERGRMHVIDMEAGTGAAAVDTGTDAPGTGTGTGTDAETTAGADGHGGDR
jgi:hypothetical protein